MNTKIFTAMIFTAVTGNAIADGSAYWVGSDGDYVRSGFGECVRTIDWTPAKAIPGCEGDAAQALADDRAAAKAKAAAKARAKADADAAARAKAQAEAAEKAREAAAAAASSDPQYRNMSLASGATFELGGSTLSVSGKAAVAALLAKFDGEQIQSVIVEGHTDDRGAASFNQQLSEKRARAVKAELIANGVDTNIIKTVGYGESSPIADNGTRTGRAQNRRVEIKVDARSRKL